MAWGQTIAGGINLSNATGGGKAGYSIDGEAAGDHAGASLAVLGDVNGDGRGTDAGADTFVFNLGEAGGDRVADFTGAGATADDVLIFTGYGNSTLSRVGSTDHYLITADAVHGGIIEDITLTGVTNLNLAVGSNDFMFVYAGQRRTGIRQLRPGPALRRRPGRRCRPMRPERLQRCETAPLPIAACGCGCAAASGRGPGIRRRP